MTATAAPATVYVGPNSEPQKKFLATRADIAIGGGAAGGGKTWGLLLDPLRYVRTERNFSAVFLRRTYPRITQPGGLWGESVKLYGMMPDAVRGRLEWRWPATGSTILFRHLQWEKTVEEWKGGQITGLYVDQLEEFTEYQFWYLMSRMRTVGNVSPYVRATVNPDPDSFVAELVKWYIDDQTGFAIPERSGVIRYFFRNLHNGELHWGSSRDELVHLLPQRMPGNITPAQLIPSFTFIPSTVYDNVTLLERDPEYLAKLYSLPTVERERLLSGNWKIRPDAGKVFPRDKWKYTTLPLFLAEWRAGNVQALVRWWDKAATEEALADPNGAYTAGVLLARHQNGTFTVVDLRRGQWDIPQRDSEIEAAMQWDKEMWGGRCIQWSEQEPGSGGKESARATAMIAARVGVEYYYEPSTGSKLERATPFAAAQQNGLASVVQGEWTPGYVDRMHRVPGKLMDDCDATSGAYSKVRAPAVTAFRGSYRTATVHA